MTESLTLPLDVLSTLQSYTYEFLRKENSIPEPSIYIQTVVNLGSSLYERILQTSLQQKTNSILINGPKIAEFWSITKNIFNSVSYIKWFKLLAIDVVPFNLHNQKTSPLIMIFQIPDKHIDQVSPTMALYYNIPNDEIIALHLSKPLYRA